MTTSRAEQGPNTEISPRTLLNVADATFERHAGNLVATESRISIDEFLRTETELSLLRRVTYLEPPDQFITKLADSSLSVGDLAALKEMRDNRPKHPTTIESFWDDAAQLFCYVTLEHYQDATNDTLTIQREGQVWDYNPESSGPIPDFVRAVARDFIARLERS